MQPARDAGKGLNLQVIFNDYVYFLGRWARFGECLETQKCGGIISFITSVGYLVRAGFVGVRGKMMRRSFDETVRFSILAATISVCAKTPNVFVIQIPVAIAMGFRGTEQEPG